MSVNATRMPARDRNRLRVAAFATAAIGLALGSPARAQTPEVFEACYVPGSGTVYRIDEPGLATECDKQGKSNAHVPFSWTDGANAVRLTTSPADGQILVWDETTDAWIPTTPAAGVSDHGALAGLADDDHAQYLLTDGVRNATTGFAVTGTLGLDGAPASGAGVRLMWHPNQAAFRAGVVDSDQWNSHNIGRGSVAFGRNTTASGPNSTATGNATTAGGVNSIALGNNATASGSGAVAMGFFVTASNNNAIATGRNTIASGPNSTAMGAFASSNGHGGSFVYGDASTFSSVVSNTANNQFMVRAAGGTIFHSNSDLTAGVSLAPGAGAWASVSDVNRKANFRHVDGAAVLEAIARMPIREWNYKSQGPSIRHVGPTAQDFYAAFGLGTSDETITTVDADGIALLAVQALERRTAELRAKTVELERKVAEIDALRGEVAALSEALAGAMRDGQSSSGRSVP